ncbi:MAG: hypothetical protein AAB895_00150 [Patescibacteria group bacterium]
MLFKHYPRLTFIVLSYCIVIALIAIVGTKTFHDIAAPFGIGGIFIAGMLYTYGFTAGIGAVFLPSFLGEHSIALISIVGGIGASFADVTIFRLIRSNLKKEIHRIASKKIFRAVNQSLFFKSSWVRVGIAFILIASPLPDELGIAVIANTKIKEETFAALMFLANVLGIYFIVSVLAPLY